MSTTNQTGKAVGFGALLGAIAAVTIILGSWIAPGTEAFTLLGALAGVLFGAAAGAALLGLAVVIGRVGHHPRPTPVARPAHGTATRVYTPTVREHREHSAPV